jgi:ethanolamine utilization cobalamin adenosyltransferase
MSGVSTKKKEMLNMSTKKTTAAKAANDTKTKTAAKSEAKVGEKPSPKLSLLNAAAAVLENSDEPLTVRRMIDSAKEKGLWEPGQGKTPEQTLYSAIVREIKVKGENSRFKKTDARGLFVWNG